MTLLNDNSDIMIDIDICRYRPSVGEVAVLIESFYNSGTGSIVDVSCMGIGIEFT